MKPLESIIESVVKRMLSSVHVGMPAKVVSYNSGSRSISAQPLVKRKYRDESGEIVLELIPIVQNVPVIFPGSGGVKISWEISTGDPVWLMVASTSIEEWLINGGVVEAQSTRRHDLNDAVAIPGLLNLSPSDSDPMIEFTGTEIHAGGSSALALHSKLEILWNHVAAMPTGTNPATPIVGTLGTGTQKLKGG